MKRYRYITSGVVSKTDPVSKFRLVGANQIQSRSHVIRITIESDDELNPIASVKLTKYACDSYATTEDARPISELDPVALVKINRRWKKADPALLDKNPHEWHNIIVNAGYINTVYDGFLPKDDFKAKYY